MACVSNSSCWLPASLTFRHLHSQSLGSASRHVSPQDTQSQHGMLDLSGQADNHAKPWKIQLAFT